MIDIQEKKNKILEFLEAQGPSLPVQVARAIQMDPVFASAILSELLSTKAIKTSHMKIGASPLYLLPTQEEKLEEKTDNLKPIEKEAQEKLKSKKIITDEDEEPATRVALRNIKDFAIPFKFRDKIIWKYAFTPQEKIDEILSPKKKEEAHVTKNNLIIKQSHNKHDPTTENDIVPKAWEVKKDEIRQAKEKSKKIENIFEKKSTPTENKKDPARISKEKTTSSKSFLEEIEQFLKIQNTTITTIEEVDKRKVIAIIKSNEKNSMLFAFNKARINETELLKCYKTADKKNLSYQIITKGDLTKKLLDTIRAHQKLIKINKLK